MILLFFTARLAAGQAPACTRTVSTYPYSESFASGQGGWTSGGLNASWALGYPTGKMEMYYPASDSNSWMTSLTGYHHANEDSYVVSPCFNFTSLVDPVIELKIWWNSEAMTDGAVLQSSINGGLTWQNVGSFGDPYNWYNGENLVSAPGGQLLHAAGWTGRVGSSPGNGSLGWVTAKHKLNGLGGQPAVRLRVAFGSNAQYEDDGFAFDDVTIYDTPNHDAGVLSLVAPVSRCGNTTQEQVTILVKNYGHLPQTSIPVSYQVGNLPHVTETITATLAPEDTLTYTFLTRLNAAASATYALKAYTRLPADAVAANDTAHLNFTSVPTIGTYPYFQNFENGNGGWLPGGSNSSWALGTPGKATINSAASGAHAWVTSLTGNYNPGENSYVMGPCFNFSNLVAPLLTMKVWWNTEEGFDGAVLQASVDGGLTWQNVGAPGDPDNWYNHADILGFPGGQSTPAAGWSGSNMNFPATGSNGWVAVKHLLTGLGGQANVKLRLAFGADPSFLTDDGFAFDDVAIYENPAHDVGITAILSPVSGTCGASNQENVTVTLKNFGTATQTAIPVLYQLGSNPPVTATFSTPLGAGATVMFTFPVKADLSAGGHFTLTAATALPADTFSTNNQLTDSISIFNAITAFPYTQHFENLTTGVPGRLPAGWELKTGSALFYPYTWQVQNGPTTFAGTGPAADHTTGTLAGKYLYASGASSPAGDSTELITPCFDLNGLVKPGFSFWYHLNGADINRFQVQISADNGASWSTLFTLNGPQQTAKTDAWWKKMIRLQGYAGKVKLKFKAVLGNGLNGDIALDDFKFYDLPSTDLELVALNLPAPGCGLSSAENVCVTVYNAGTAVQSFVPLNYQLNSGPVVTEIYPGTIPALTAVQYCFNTKADLTSAGNHEFVAFADVIGDADNANDTVKAHTFKLPVVATFPYFQDFESGYSYWVARGQYNSWALGTPAKPVIKGAASGTKAWVTGLTGPYNPHENSYVSSPCFNFSALTGDPDFEMKAWWNANRGSDGAVLQSSVDGGLTWQNVGEFNDPHNWYNDSTIYAQPGNQPNYRARGWSGTVQDSGSKGWVTVKHKLTGLAGQPSVQLRLAFAADAWGQEDGFAFDDVRITDNTHNLAVNGFAPLTAFCGFSANESVTVELENLGSPPIANVSMHFRVNQGAPVIATFAGPLAGGAKTNFTFPVGANLTGPGLHQITVVASNPNDPDRGNDTLRYTLKNALYANLPLTFDFETTTTDLSAFQVKTNRLSGVTAGAGASFGAGTQGMILEGKNDTTWLMPVGLTNPWTSNPENFAAAYFCVTPTHFATTDSLWLEFELKQLFELAAANTNFRVTVNGQQVGITHRPPFAGGPATWKHVKIPLTRYINQGTLQIGLESSVKAEYANGTGTANLIDNIRVSGNPTLGAVENIWQRSVVIYPNPSAGLVNLQLPAPEQDYELEVREPGGKVVLKQKAGSGTQQLNLQSLAKGLYFLKITGEKHQTVKKLILK